jgi:hypothetical protein
VKYGSLLVAALITTGCTMAEVHPAQTSRPACKNWSVGGTWAFSQSNGFFITFVIQQHGDRLNGTGDSGSGPAPLAGTMKGDQLTLAVSWASGGAGLYTATMSPSGELTNTFTQNISMPSSTATWGTTTRFTCR